MKTKNKTDYMNFDEKRYRAIYKFKGKSELLEKIWSDAYKDDYPKYAEPFGFVTISDLNKIEAELNIKEGETLLDMGCGKGGLGLAVAQNTKAKLIGMDVVEEAIEQAEELKKKFNLNEDVVFRVGSFSRTNLPDSSVHAVMSVDTFWMVIDKLSAIKEMVRILIPGSRFVLTSWVPLYLDLDKMLQKYNFKVLANEETFNWTNRQLAVYEGITKYQHEIRKEMGDEAAQILISEAMQAPSTLSAVPRRMLITEKM